MKLNIDTLSIEEKVSLALRGVYEQFGYKRFKMSKFEEYSLYSENKSFLSSDNIITFNDLDGKLMALKPDVTLSIAKNAKALSSELEKLYYIENVYRLDKNTKKYREINQMGLEAIGAIKGYTTIEVIMLALKSLKEIDSKFVLDISSVAFVTGLIESLHLTDYAIKDELFACIVSKNLHDLKRLVDKLDLSAEESKKLSKLITINGGFSNAIKSAKEIISNEEMRLAVEELEAVYKVIENTEFEDKLRLDFSIINDTNYYNGIIFQGYVSRIPRAVLSGGRYDKLLAKFNKNCSAIGFALYLNEINSYYHNLSQNDIDVLILYDKTTNIAKLYLEVEQLVKSGKSVFTATKIPSDIKFNAIMAMSSDKIREVK
ncbi:MAG: ATP phosphoribosyltransferase regulatory subunit [Clostridia bacterium]